MHRHTSVVVLALLAVVASACGSEGSLGVQGDGFEANPENKLLPAPDLFAQWQAPEGASATLLATPTARASASASLGTNLDLGDDQCAQVPLQFDYTFYGFHFTSVWVCSNGNITLNVDNPSNAGLLPQPNVRMLAPANGDWRPEKGANNVFVQTVGVAPGRRFIVTWNNVRLFNSPSRGELRSTFRAILHETSNLAELDYASVREVRTDKMRAGISAGTTKYILSATGAEILALSGTSICFTPAGTSYTESREPCPLIAPPNSAPTADAGGPYAAEEGSPILFNGVLSADPDGDALSFAWSFGDGGEGTGAEASHVYADQGAYPVSLLVSDPDGLTAEATATANVFNVAPSVSLGSAPASGFAAMVAPAPVLSGDVYRLTASFSDPGVGDAPWSWTLNWGNGETDQGQTSDQSTPIVVERRLLAAGSYDVTLFVKDKDGDSSSASATVVVSRLGLELDMKPGDDDDDDDGDDDGDDDDGDDDDDEDGSRSVGDDPLQLNLGSRGKFWIAIRTTPSVNAADVLVSTVRLGGAPVLLARRGIRKAKLEDVDGDGDRDLLLQFETQDLVKAGSVGPFTTSIELVADLVDGRQGAGSGPVVIRGRKR
ncbi:MAG TPA: PKD domain-containing protein [Gemmatimonadaceae bacterium]